MTDLSPAGLKAARAILGWSLRDVAEKADVALTTVHQIENGKRSAQSATSDKLTAAFAAHGVEVLPPPRAGARLAP